ncbi:MAG: hypothetical protein H5U36_08115 [Candidatus Caldatribacterium sp.]|nr:hypothetical protein [Candidatus Caldatribacterium sp.]
MTKLSHRCRGSEAFSLIEVIIIIAIAGFVVSAIALLALRISLIKSTNENLLTASTLAEDVIERIREKSIDGFSTLQTIIGNDADQKEVYFDSNEFAQLCGSSDIPPEILAALDKLPDSEELSFVRFEVIGRNPLNGSIEKLRVAVVIRWREAARSTDKEREYILTTQISRLGFGKFLK